MIKRNQNNLNRLNAFIDFLLVILCPSREDDNYYQKYEHHKNRSYKERGAVFII